MLMAIVLLNRMLPQSLSGLMCPASRTRAKRKPNELVGGGGIWTVSLIRGGGFLHVIDNKNRHQAASLPSAPV